MKVLKTFGNVCCVLLTMLSVVVCAGYAYYKIFNTDITIGVNYIDNQVGKDIIFSDDMTDEEKNTLADRYFIEINYYSNENDNGIELQELKFNYFTDYTLTSDKYRSTGMQYLGTYESGPYSPWNGKYSGFMNPFKNNIITKGNSDEDINQANNYIDMSFNYYDSTNGTTFNGVTDKNGSVSTPLKRTTTFTVKIDSKPYVLKLDKSYEEFAGDIKNFLGFKLGEVYAYKYYTYGNLFQTCMQAVKRANKTEGYAVFDMSDYFTVHEFDEKTGKIKTDDVTDIIKNYVAVKFKYSANGAKNANQSLFNIIDNNSKYNTDDSVDTTYWQERVVYSLTEQQLSLRYSSVYDGYFISLPLDLKQKFEQMPRRKVNFIIDLQSKYLTDKNMKIIGIDSNAFENFDIDTFTIKGNSQTFYLLDKSFTNLQTLSVSEGIELEISEGALNFECEVVKL